MNYGVFIFYKMMHRSQIILLQPIDSDVTIPRSRADG